MNRAWWLCLLLVALDARAADVYRLDTGHTRVSFDVRRLGIPWIAARFQQFEGDFVIDRSGPGSRIEVAVRTDAIEGLEFGWNARLRSESWLDTRRFPQMSYVSTHVEFDRAGGAVASGQLTLHGITRPVTLNVSRLDCAAAPSNANQTCSFAAYARIKRSDFGLPNGFWLAGDNVEISVTGVALHSDQHLASTAFSAP